MFIKQMFFKFLWIIPMSLTLCLYGCGIFKPDTELKIDTIRVEKVAVPGELTEPCVAEKPIAKQDYLALKPHEREEELTRYTVELLGTIRNCNIQLEKIKALNPKPKQ